LAVEPFAWRLGLMALLLGLVGVLAMRWWRDPARARTS
jgi:hypothetical protein